MDLLEDLELIASLSDETFDKVIQLISTHEINSLEWALALRDFSKESGDQSVKGVIRFINFLADSLMDVTDYSNKLEEINKIILEITEDELKAKSAWEKIYASVDKFEKFFLLRKEEDIKDRFKRVKSFKVTTDIRPVFTMDKSAIEKYLFPSILKIEAGNDSDNSVFICEFYEDSIDKLIDELKTAKEKTKVIKDKISG